MEVGFQGYFPGNLKLTLGKDLVESEEPLSSTIPRRTLLCYNSVLTKQMAFQRLCVCKLITEIP